MSTPHNQASPGEFAKTVLMPGDPLRAKVIAETYLESPKQVNGVRGMLGFTGTFQGKAVSVMGSGMGMPSIGIYSYELYKFYGVENIIRIGSAGSYCEQAKLYDVILAESAYSESSFAKVQNGYTGTVTHPSEALNSRLERAAAALGFPILKGTIHSSDVFYREDPTPYYQELYRVYGCLCVEMESFALFHNAAVLGKNAACLLTISDSFVNGAETTAEERQTAFTKMMEIALNAVE